MFGWFFGKKEVEKVKEDAKKGFNSVRNDIQNLTQWIKHLDIQRNKQEADISAIKEDLSSVTEEIEGVKNMVSILGNLRPSGGFKTFKQLSNKQAGVLVDQTADQTADQTPNFNHFSITEKAIIWILLNTDMKLSYEDLAAILGKERSTIRNQLNGIKQKSLGIIEEIIEKNGKKRVFVPENIKEIILKKVKVRVNKGQKFKKKQGE